MSAASHNSPPPSESHTDLTDNPVEEGTTPSHNDTLLEPLRTAISAARRPFCVAGDIPLASPLTMTILPAESDALMSHNVRFPPPSPDALAPLIDACKQASFGRGKEEVLDSDYRQALVLSKDRFGIIPHSAIDPLVQGILPAIQKSLYPSTDFGGVAQRRVVAELDKLNVYGQGDFFKGHVDTPRSPDMFGTLLLNLPVKHEGGELVVHAPHGLLEGAEPRKTNWGSETSIGWIAFFSDCPHEVLPVTSGNRVTLTYNLTIAPPFDEPSPADTQTQSLGGVQDAEFTKVLEALRPVLSGTDQSRLCFHFEHRYPVDLNSHAPDTALPILKGCDALVYRAFIAAGLEVSFHYVCILAPDYDREEVPEPSFNTAYILPSTAKEWGDGYCDDGFPEVVRMHKGKTAGDLGVLEIRPPRDLERVVDRYEGTWNEKDKDKIVGAPFRYVAYGNEPSVAVEYASICIIGSQPGQDINDHWPEGLRARGW